MNPDIIINAASAHYAVSAESVRGRGRMQTVVMARQVAMYVMRHVTPKSFEEIGRYFGRHHATVITNCRRVKQNKQMNAAALEVFRACSRAVSVQPAANTH